MTSIARCCCLLAALSSSAACLWGQTLPATTQTIAPVAPRHILSLPPGFVLIEQGDIKVICDPADQEWVKQALVISTPSTRPSTMPSDLQTRWRTARENLAARIAHDFTLPDPSAISARLDRFLTEDLHKLQSFNPPLFYLTSTNARLKELLKTEAWTNPSYSYNRLADDIVYRETVSLTIERPMDDTIISCFYEPADSAGARAERLHRTIDATRREVDQMISGRAMYLVQMDLAEVVQELTFAPLKLPRDQQWLNVGLAGASSATYAADVIGSPPRELLLLQTAELRSNRLKARSIDLLNPVEPAALKKQYALAYADAYRRKAIAIGAKIFEAGREKLPALMASLREKPPTSGQDLVTRVREITGVDVSADVGSR